MPCLQHPALLTHKHDSGLGVLRDLLQQFQAFPSVTVSSRHVEGLLRTQNWNRAGTQPGGRGRPSQPCPSPRSEPCFLSLQSLRRTLHPPLCPTPPQPYQLNGSHGSGTSSPHQNPVASAQGALVRATHRMLGKMPGIQPSQSQLSWASSTFPGPGQARYTNLLSIRVMWPQRGWLP